MPVSWDDTAALTDAHDRFLAGRLVRRAVRPPILSSWERCRSLGIAADHVEVLYHTELDLGGSLADAARPVLDRLETQVSGIRVSAVLCDQEARVLERRVGEHSLNRFLDSLNLAPGFAFSEELTGTNGMGTALAARQPAFVCGREHFADIMRQFACAAAPIRDPLSGRVLGALDLTCNHRHADASMLGLVHQAAVDVEQRLLDRITARERALLAAFPRGRPREAADALGRRDRLVLEELAMQLIAAGHAGVAEAWLPGGRGVTLWCREARSRSGATGFLVEAVLAGVDGLYRCAPQDSLGSPDAMGPPGGPGAVPLAHAPLAPGTSAPDTPGPDTPVREMPGPEILVPETLVATARSADAPAPFGEQPRGEPLAVGEPGVSRLALLARERLGLLCEAGVTVGTTLDVTRTAEELTEVAVPRFADYVVVDLPDCVLRGEEPVRTDGPLRRVAMAGAGVASHLYPVGEAVGYAPSTPQARALATGDPVLEPYLHEAHGWLAHDPNRGGRVLRAGIHSLIAVPMRARGVVLGVAGFYRSALKQPFEEDDLSLAEDLVSRAAVCIDNARRFTREHATALALQRSLLPRGLPAQHAVEAAHRYRPATTGVGGDWFDVIPLSGARVALAVGDVVGHGLHATATMGRLRTAVHNFSALDLAVDEVLTQLDDLVCRLDPEAMGWDGMGAEGPAPDAPSTGGTESAAGPGTADSGHEPGIVGSGCLYAVYDPVTRRCTAARAGHPPPALVLPDGTVEFPDVPPGPPLGVGGLPFETADFAVPEGSLLVLYTDGLLTGATGRDAEVGFERLRTVLARAGRTPEQACDALESLLPDRPADDVVLLVARTRALADDQVAVWDLPADPAEVSRARQEVLDRLTEWGLEEPAFTTELIVSELVTNAIRYGREPLQLRLLRERALICEMADGSSTSPRLRRARTTDEGGRGLFLVAQLAQRWGTRYTEHGKVIWTEQPLPRGGAR
ncbi:SpoIIE family protein phosphatase [Streptomyces sp. NPDC020480]|uniref:SpoIIE family protein phosphatase n=1 Tax=Streptomyces sp. NPDC020480 TaxID=3365076 RepID=UPI0037AAF97C